MCASSRTAPPCPPAWTLPAGPATWLPFPPALPRSPHLRPVQITTLQRIVEPMVVTGTRVRAHVPRHHETLICSPSASINKLKSVRFSLARTLFLFHLSIYCSVTIFLIDQYLRRHHDRVLLLPRLPALLGAVAPNAEGDGECPRLGGCPVDPGAVIRIHILKSQPGRE